VGYPDSDDRRIWTDESCRVRHERDELAQLGGAPPMTGDAPRRAIPRSTPYCRLCRHGDRRWAGRIRGSGGEARAARASGGGCF